MEDDRSIVIAGFGGQGVLFAGLVLAHAGMNAGLNVTWWPSYGPEMRGGTANSTVVISRQEIGAPIVARPSAVVVMNEPSLVKYGPRVRPGGTLVINRSMARSPFSRPDIRVVEIPAGDVAAEVGNERVANMVALGALVRATELLPLDLVEEALAETLGRGKEHLLGPNLDALRRGAELVGRPPRLMAA